MSRSLHTLPTECTIEICHHLDLHSLLRLRSTSRSLHHTITVFDRTLASSFIQRDIHNPTQARRALSKAPRYRHLTIPSNMFIYAELMQRQRIATDILQALLGEMGIQRPRAMNDTLASIYILWEVLEAWRQKADECPADSLEQDESVALQTQILRELEDGQLDELVWMVGALSGLVCGWLAKSMRRGDNRTSDGAAMLEIPLEDQAGGVVSEGLEVVHEVLFGVKQRHDERMDGSCARKTVDNIPSKWFLFVAALEVMEERELITQWDKVLRFVSVTEFIQRKGANW